jgi:diguanylate cyclase
MDVLLASDAHADPIGDATEPVEVELVTGSGGRRPVELLRRPMAERNGVDTVFAIRDISERKAAEGWIEHLAYHDPLTGLANRALFTDRLAQAIVLAERSHHGIALICLDLDRFKSVNDLLGHPGGDRVLVEAGARVRRVVRDMDTAARLGGDEFAVVQQLASQREAAFLAERMLAELSQPYEIDGRQVTIGTSIGIALFPADGQDATTLMKNADLALYRAKSDGRGVFRCFEPEMDARVQERRAMEEDLRQAIARGELELNYQPQVESQTLEITGFEALLRWTHPVRGRVPPAEFIPLAEETGLIIMLGHWVLDTACQEAASWTKPYRIAVNLSPAQFKEAGLAEMIRATLARHGLDPARLELEITEGVLIEDAERALSVLQELKRSGVRIALDDFGTGYSSLSYLRRFPFDMIKIDGSFVQGIGEDNEAEAIVSAVIAMGRNLGLDVTAEGVETRAQLGMLRSQRCTQLQGFLLGRPTAAVAYTLVQTPAEAA